MKTIGERIRAEREAQGIERAELARLAGMAKTTLADLEVGASKSTTKLHRIADALSVSVQWLETGKGRKTSDPALEAAPHKASQPVRLDAPTLASVARVLKQVCGIVGWEFDLEDPTVAELFAASYEWRTSDEANDVTLTARVIDFVKAREAKRGGGTGGSGSAAAGGIQESARRKGAA